jgi:hypothetical protein
LNDFEAELMGDLAELQKLYIHNVQSIGGLCSPMPKVDPSAKGYIRWISAKVAGIPEMFASVNENFISTAVERALVIAGKSVDLSALQDVTAVSGDNILTVERHVQRAARTMSKKWWCSFG